MSFGAVDRVVGSIAGLKEFYESLDAVEIPGDLASAVRDGWEMSQGPLATTIGLAYSKDARRLDRQRLVPLSAMLNHLADFEEHLIATQVKNPVALAWKVLTREVRVLRYLVDNWYEIWKLLKEVLGGVLSFDWERAVKAFDQLEAVLFGAVAIILSVLTKESFSACVDTVSASRDRYADKMRAVALPQRNGPRFQRRMRARQ